MLTVRHCSVLQFCSLSDSPTGSRAAFSLLLACLGLAFYRNVREELTCRYCNPPVLQHAGTATRRYCNMPVLQPAGTATRRYCNTPVLQPAGTATRRYCNPPVLQRAGTATRRYCNAPVLQPAGTATRRYCNAPVLQHAGSHLTHRQKTRSPAFSDLVHSAATL
ncbi:uncharacterized protein LOC119910918 isoform X2 [Micropterus salmoides]|uniref:uncharacterized protein LOC119910918 isoform X2 n=1 Tax=Micropterus salmoides TaxID=27706 RepID=UPI0018EAF978|nr:uncharacterized protein LOC119910918 isoform X2 [Micropterus salmoides]